MKTNRTVKNKFNFDDFTHNRYRELLKIAKKKYKFVFYNDILKDKKSILWRHDLDLSINRAYELAIIENEEKVRSTFFINPHSEFYNPFEKSQSNLIFKIINLGHSIGLHFDAEYHNVTNEKKLDFIIKKEAMLLKDIFGYKPKVFSFHNPTKFLLQCDDKSYGGLINTYSSWFKKNVKYCSDSNGYWRFESLNDILFRKSYSYLQVLTHPGWWQKKPLFPRERVFRCIYGRAEANLSAYDELLKNSKRNNLVGEAKHLISIKGILPDSHKYFDFLWNQFRYESLFFELWRLIDKKINNHLQNVLKKDLRFSDRNIKYIFEKYDVYLNNAELFFLVFKINWDNNRKNSNAFFTHWSSIKYKVLAKGISISNTKYKEGCLYLFTFISEVFPAIDKQENIVVKKEINLIDENDPKSIN